MNSNKVKTMCLTAVFMALTFVVTRFIQIPIPLGYFNIGNSIILIGCMFVSMPYGISIGGIASALADLTSYPVYAIPTLIIKSLMPMVFYSLQKLNINNDLIKKVLSFSIATLIPLFGYTITGCILYGGIAAGLTQFPGLLLEYIANIVVYTIFYKMFKKISGNIK